MYYEFDITNEEVSHFIYIDNNIFRLSRDKAIWNMILSYFDENYPKVFGEPFDLLFTWAQLFEDINLGNIMNRIERHPIWKKFITGKGGFKTIFRSKSAIDALDYIFEIVKKIICELIQEASILDKIKQSLERKNFNLHPQILEATLLKVDKYIKKNDYIDELSTEFAWAFITAHQFIKQVTKQVNGYDYFDTLIVIWHRLMQKGYQLNLYRFIQNRYLCFNSNIESLKHGSDLCDSELIDYAVIGAFINKKISKVICITKDNAEEIQQRRTILQQTLTELRDVKDWDISPIPGEIFCLKLDEEDKKIVGITHILP